LLLFKVRSAFEFIKNSWTERFDWILRIDDDSYVVFDNLRQFLSNFNHAQLMQFGSHCRISEDKIYFIDIKPGIVWPRITRRTVDYISTGPGIVLSSAAFKLLMKFLMTKNCSTNLNTHADDVELGKCLKIAGVPYGNSSDANGRLRFIPVALNNILYHPEEIKYFKAVSVYPMILGYNCCSEELISWHYVTAVQMVIYHEQVTLLQHRKEKLRLSSFTIT
jgi:glycoprotein-N-acetylgalactosamine 3-beta-galactosyltransferase